MSGSESIRRFSTPARRWQGKRLGKFRLLSLLGQGAMGKVFRAEDTTLQRLVALKIMVMPDGDGPDSPSVRRFLGEARAAARLSHPHIVNILEIDQHRDLLYIAMDLIEGGDAQALLEAGGPLAVGRACAIAADAAEALAFGHSQGVLHRDVKPSNLLLTRHGRAKLADFGLAELQHDDGPLADASIVGTPRYMAPELDLGQPASPASDQYSLGATLWHLLTGRPVFDAPRPRDILHLHVQSPLPDLAGLQPQLPADLVSLITRMLNKNPAHRHPDLLTLASELRRFADISRASPNRSSSASTPEPNPSAGPGRAPAPSRGKGWLLAALLILAVLLGVGLATVTFLGLSQPHGTASTSATPAPTPPADRRDSTPTPPAAPSPDVDSSTSSPASDRPTPLPTRTATSSSSADQATPPTPADPTPKPAEPASSPPTFDARQTEQLKELADRRALATVRGTVARAYLSSSGKTLIVRFVGNPGRGFQVVWLPDRFDAMAQAFGGEHGEAIAGQLIAVTGKLESSFGMPRIVVTDPAQIQRLPPAGEESPDPVAP